MVVMAERDRPAASPRTRCRSPAWSATMKMSAIMASVTNNALPLSLPPEAVTPAPSRAPATGSAMAMPATISPEAILGSHSDC